MLMEFRGIAPRIGPGAFIAETASVIGDVAIGKDSSVWFGAVIRGDSGSITVGEGSNIQDNATLHCHPASSLTVGNNVTVGHNAIVHCSEVGDDTLVGMGAILMSGARIGRHCVIGAGAVVTENTVVPDGAMMLGVPARVVRTLDADTVALLEKQSLYVGLAGQYLKESAARESEYGQNGKNG